MARFKEGLLSIKRKIRDRSMSPSPFDQSLAENPAATALPKVQETLGLFEFTDLNESSSCDIDIIAVHGLDGDFKSSWTHKDSKALWLRDFLPQQLEREDIRARVMSYGYNAGSVFTKATTNIDNSAETLLTWVSNKRESANEKKRPIIFIAHSLGGLIVKKAIIIAHEQLKSLETLLKSIGGIVFFGVPHRGSESAWVTESVTKLAKISSFNLRGNTNFIEALKSSSDVWFQISKQFVERAEALEIQTFFETERTGGILIVNEKSARLEHNNEKAMGLPGSDHVTLCKFRGTEEQRYQPVWMSIKNMARVLINEDRNFSLAKYQLSKEEGDCMEALHDSDEKDHRRRNPDPVKGTCQWILTDEKYSDWIGADTAALLWISADPGAGKSVLASYLIDAVNGPKAQRDRPNVVLYFFFEDDNEAQINATLCIRSLLFQLFTFYGGFVQLMLPEYRTKKNNLMAEMHSLWSIFLKSLQSKEVRLNVTCIIDALDECEQNSQRNFMHLVSKYFGSSEGQSDRSRLRMLITSRPHSSIERGLFNPQTIRLKAEDMPSLTQSDIELVVKDRVSKLGSLRNIPSSRQQALVEQILERSDSTFLWVSLVLTELEESLSASEQSLLHILDQVPRTIEEVYEGILNKAHERENARRMLKIILCAARPLTINELNDAFHLHESHSKHQDLDLVLEPFENLRNFIRYTCGLFVKIVESKVYLIHQTAREFLIGSSKDEYKSQWHKSFDLTDCHMELAQICVGYLLFDDSEQRAYLPPQTGFCSLSDDSDDEDSADESDDIEGDAKAEIREKNDDDGDDVRDRTLQESDICSDLNTSTIMSTFYEYAATYWAMHFREAQRKANTILLERVLGLYDSSSFVFRLWYTYQEDKYWLPKDPRFPQLLSASYCGHEQTVRLLLDRDADINAQDRHGGTALYWACRKGWDTVIKTLLDNKATTNSVGHMYKAPLHIAALNGHTESLKILLDYGVDIDATTPYLPGNSYKSTALQDAVFCGRFETVQALLERGANVHKKNKLGQSPIGMALEEGWVDIVKLLRASGADPRHSKQSHPLPDIYWAARLGDDIDFELLSAKYQDINAKDEESRTTLSYLCKEGNQGACELLLKNGADEAINCVDKDGQTALVWALTTGRDGIVELLLEHGANINQRDKKGRTILYNSLHLQRTRAFQGLLRRGADTTSQNGSACETVLSAASRDHDSSYLRLLLREGVDIRAKNIYGWTALHHAVFQGRKPAVRLLIASGADVEAKDEFGDTPLHLAAQPSGSPDEAMIRLLIENGADRDARNNRGWTALHNASAERGSQRAIELLLERGADAQVTTDDGETPLMIATRYDGLATIELLIQKGSNVKVSNSCGETVLHIAVLHGSGKVVDLLIAKGADISAKDQSGNTVLHYVARFGDEATIETLLRQKADIDAKNDACETSLHLAAQRGSETIVKLLLQGKADILAKDKFDCMALHFAARQDREAVVELLLRQGADIEAKANKGLTSLHMAAENKAEATVKLLLRNGADINAQDEGGETALQKAVLEMDVNIVQLLLENGAEVGTTDSEEWNCLLQATNGRLRYEEVHQLLRLCMKKQ